jgi:hypothetical protein
MWNFNRPFRKRRALKAGWAHFLRLRRKKPGYPL